TIPADSSSPQPPPPPAYSLSLHDALPISGGTVDSLVQDGVLNSDCSLIFRRGKSENGPGEALRLHQHQEDAIRTAKTGGSYVLISEEHTFELQSLRHLVCRLLLEKKKNKK